MKFKNDLTAEYVRERLDYDPKPPGIFRWKYCSYKTPNHNSRDVGRVAGSKDKDGYVKIRFENGTYAAHRLAILYITGEWPEYEVDHIDQNTANNAFSNLRPATHGQNRSNTNPYKNNTSGFKGVIWNKQNKKWSANISINRQRYHLGYFIDKDDAIAAYKVASLKYHQEFSVFT